MHLQSGIFTYHNCTYNISTVFCYSFKHKFDREFGNKIVDRVFLETNRMNSNCNVVVIR